MALSAGDHLGSYVIVGPIGAGGMGAVFKARDERLARFVALKILHTPTATDAGLRERFQCTHANPRVDLEIGSDLDGY